MNFVKALSNCLSAISDKVEYYRAASEMRKIHDVVVDRMTDIEASLRELEKKDRERHAEIRVLHSRVTYLMREHNDYSN